ncbi:MAG: VOC family protein [Gemmatimonadetes bacterium]|mgnify:CR=1 FL=1|nr:VOC family protein [Gemmatimonadota bacterium]MCC6769739.1 VOC family protein [Gemmatimonadaceae bacterium]
MSTIQLDCTQISAGLTASDLQRSLTFYVDGLGFTLGEQHVVDGTLRFAMLKAGQGELGIGQDDFAKGKDRVKGVGMRLWITTAQDLNALANQVKQAGFALDSEVEPLPWGPLGFAVTDPDGFMLTISNPG